MLSQLEQMWKCQPKTDSSLVGPELPFDTEQNTESDRALKHGEMLR